MNLFIDTSEKITIFKAMGTWREKEFFEVFKICNGLSRIKLNELFTLDDSIKGTRGHSWKLAKFWCTWDCCIFFSNRVIIRWNQPDQWAVGASSINAFKGCLNKIRERRMGFFRCQDTLDPRHFGPKTLRHHGDGSEMSGHFGTGAEVSMDTSALVPNCLPAIRQIVTRDLDVGVAAM